MSYLIEEHLGYLESRGKSPATVKDRGLVLRRLHADLPMGLGWATQDQLIVWFAEFARARRSPWTLITYDMHARGFYRWADGRYLEGDPMAAIERPRQPAWRPYPVTEEELRLTLARCSPYWRGPVLLGALAGLRSGEMARLRREDITPEWIRIRRAKGGDPATVPTHPQILELAQAHGQEWMVPGSHGRPVTAKSLPSRAREYFDSIGLPAVRLHRFRHYFATSLMRAGVDIRTVQTLMRHASLQTTAAYLQVVDERRTAGVRLLPQLI